MLDRGFVLYGSDSGHQAGGMGGMGGGKQPSHLATDRLENQQMNGFL